MKKVILAVLCLSLPVFAAATRSAEPVSEPEAPAGQQEPASPEDASFNDLPYCWQMDQGACTPPGSTQNCTDGYYSDYVCTCMTYTAPGQYTYESWDCPDVR